MDWGCSVTCTGNELLVRVILLSIIHAFLSPTCILISSVFFLIGREIEPYFPSHPERNTYVTLLQQTNPPASDALLKAALIRRAMADVERAMRIREDKPALQNLLQKGSVGDDIWTSILAAEKELEAEVIEVMQEANSFMQGWGQFIFPTAGEMVQNQRIKKHFDEIPVTKAEKGRCFALLTGYSCDLILQFVSTYKEEIYLPKKKKHTPALTKEDSEKPVKSSSPTPVSSRSPPPEKSKTSTSPQSTNGKTLAPPSSTVDGESVASLSEGELATSSPTSSKSKKSVSPFAIEASV